MSRRSGHAVAGLLLVTAAGLARSGDSRASDLSFQGYARDLSSGRILYVESHAVHAAGTPEETRVVLYRCPKGEAFARKELRYGALRAAPDFTFTDARFGHIEGLRGKAPERQVFDQPRSGEPLRSRPVTGGADLVADAGFDEFVQQHWRELESGDAVRFPFLVPSRLDTLTFKVRKHGETLIEGANASVIRLNLSGFLGWFLPYIEVSYRKSDRVLMRYKGITNVWDEKGDNHTAQIDFPGGERRTAPVDLELDRAVTLVTHCG
jgi:hypothetical protein